MKNPILTNLINDFLLESNKANPNYKPTPSFRPSSLGTICQRAIFYSFWRVTPDEELTAKNHITFQMGDAIHEIIGKWLRGAGVLIDYKKPDGTPNVNRFTGEPDYEFPVHSEDLGIPKAKIDAILKIDGKLWIGEYKSINDGGFNGKKYPSGFVLPPLKSPKREHLRQAMMYPFLFEQCLQAGEFEHIKELEGFTEVEGVIFLYMNKNDGMLKEYKLKKDFTVFEDVVHDILDVKEHNEAKTLPPKNQKENCRFCNWASKCKKNYNPQK